MDSSPKKLIEVLYEMREDHKLNWRYRTALSWCIAKLTKLEKDRGLEDRNDQTT